MTAYATIDDLRLYLPQVADLGIQQITIEGAPSGGTFTLIYEDVASSAIAYNASATAVQTALRAIAAIGSSGVNVRGSPGGPYVASFQGTLATDAGPLSLGTNSLTGGTSPTVTIGSATDATLQLCLDNATDIVRATMRSLLADPAFDYAAFGSADTAIVLGYDTQYLKLPPFEAGSVTLVEWMIGANPATYQTIPDEWIEEGGYLYRAIGWGADSTYGGRPRYRVTAVWGYGASAPPAVSEVTLELAVNIWRTRDKGGFTDTVGVDGSGATKQVAGLTNLQKQVLIAQRDTLITIGV